MKRTFLAIAVMSLPAAGWAQEFTRYPGLSPEQQRILEPIRTPPPEPKPSPPVSLITPPAPIQSTEPQVTQFPGSGMPVDRRDRPPRGLRPTPQDRSKPPPNELTAPPADLMERPTTMTPSTTSTRPAAPPPAPRAVAPPPAPTPAPAASNVQSAPSSTTSIPRAAPASNTVRATQPAPRTEIQAAPPPRAEPRSQPPAQTRSTAPHETPSHWRTVTLPPAPDFARRNEPARGVPPSLDIQPRPAPGLADEGAARARIEADGYRQVRGLTRDADGTWRGRAMRGEAEIGVRVDARGSVSAE